MNPRDLLELMGRRDIDPAVEAALRHYAVRNRPELEIDEEDADGPVVETQSWVKNSRAGIEFGFHDEAAWIGLDETEYGNRPMLLTQIYLYGQHDDVLPYTQPFPFELQLSDNRIATRIKLNAFESSRRSHGARDTWDIDGLRITVAYADGESCIDYVLCLLREPPLPELPYALAQVPSVKILTDLLGLPLGDPAIQDAFGPLGLQDRLEQIAETGEADFVNPYGFMLHFADASKISGSIEKFPLSVITFFQARELGARAWPSALPLSITFDDSPEMVMKKIGRPPDRAQDGEENGFAEWLEPTSTLHIFYTTMENRVLRISLVVPGYGTQ